MVDLCLVALPNPVLSNPKMYFPLGLLYVAASADDNGFDVEIVDMRAGEKKIPKAEFYGFSCTTPEIATAKKMARKVKGKTIVGGPHPSLLPSDCKEFDFIVSGEGELPILAILSGEVKTKFVTASNRMHGLDALAYPAWDLVDEPFSEELFPGERYGRGEKAATLIASRGCPYSCAFCANVYRKPVIYRSSTNIIGELQALKERGVNYFRFEDDNFTLHPQFSDLCLDLRSLDIRYKCHTRSHLMTKGKARLLKWSGCEECGLGVESGDQDVLNLNLKKESVTHHLTAAEILQNEGIRVKTYLMAGLPGETENSMKLTQDFVRQAQPDKWTLSTFTPYPGCAVFERPREFGVKIDDWDYSHWWNFCEKRFVHTLEGQTQEEMWDRYLRLYDWLKGEAWRTQRDAS